MSYRVLVRTSTICVRHMLSVWWVTLAVSLASASAEPGELDSCGDACDVTMVKALLARGADLNAEDE